MIKKNVNNKKDIIKYIDAGDLSGGEKTLEGTAKDIIDNIKTENEEEIQYSQNLIIIYQNFINEFGTPEIVFYPCCGIDGSATKVFKNVIHLDQFRGSVIAMQKQGFTIKEGDVREFELENKADLIILMNPQVDAQNFTKNLKPKGYIICNNYHLTADEFWIDPEFIFIKNIETGEKQFKPVKDIKESSYFSTGEPGYFLFQKK